MSGSCCGTGRHNSRTLSRAVADHIAAMRTAWNRRRAMREMESMPYDLRKDIGWRSGL